MSMLFFTGYPGFLGSRLLPRILRRTEGTHAICLVQPAVAGFLLEFPRTHHLKCMHQEVSNSY